MNRAKAQTTMFTIGHSTRSLQEFIELLKVNRIELLVDIRSFPGSRRYPHFSKGNLERSLPEAGIEYVHEAELGGRRKTSPQSINTGWRNDAFRGYADYMQTEEFNEALHKLMKLAQGHNVAIMCAESLPWRCHRFLVSDALVVAGVNVKHIISDRDPEEHKLANFAHIEGKQIIYR